MLGGKKELFYPLNRERYLSSGPKEKYLAEYCTEQAIFRPGQVLSLAFAAL